MSISRPGSVRTAFFGERVSPQIRVVAVTLRILAMNGKLERALEEIAKIESSIGSESHRDLLAIKMLKAELLFLDARYEEAESILKVAIDQHIDELTPEETFAIRQNYSDIRFASSFSGADEFQNTIDQKRFLGFEWLDYSELFDARNNLRKGKNYKTRPALWRQHRRAYLHGCWLAQRWTNGLLAEECIALRDWKNAAHFSICARDDEHFEAIADGIMGTRDSRVVDEVLRHLLAIGNLRSHFAIACKLIVLLSDLVPTDLVEEVSKWSLARGIETESSPFRPAAVSGAWDVLAAIGSRIPNELAGAITSAAVSHPFWITRFEDPNRLIPARQHIVKALIPLCHVLDQVQLRMLANDVLPLAEERRQVSDYDDVVDLLCHLAVQGGDNLRSTLAEKLYPRGSRITTLLAQVSYVFGKSTVIDDEQLKTLAQETATQIRRQVQWLGNDLQPEPVGEQVYEFSANHEGRTVKVYLAHLVMLYALAKQKSRIPSNHLTTLVKAMLDMIEERHNFLANRASLLAALLEFADVLSVEMCAEVVTRVELIALGQFAESNVYQTAEEASDPLNPFKHHSGRPDELQGVALIVLAEFSSRISVEDREIRTRAHKIIADAMSDSKGEIRRAGYRAARRLSDPAEELVFGVLIGLRDPDSSGATSAFATLAEAKAWKLTESQWQLFVMSVLYAQRTGNPNLRRHAASALSARLHQCPVGLKESVVQLAKLFREDICFSVRESASAEDIA